MYGNIHLHKTNLFLGLLFHFNNIVLKKQQAGTETQGNEIGLE